MDDEDLASLIAGDDTAAAPGSPEAPAPAPADEQAPAAAAPVEPSSTPEPGHVPIATLLEERERRQALERRLAETLAAERASEFQAAEAQLPPEEQQQAQLWALRRDISREMLAGRHGEEEARALEAWGFEACERDPHFNAQVYQARNPYEFIRQARQREQLLAEVSVDDLDDYRAWKAGRAGEAPPRPAPSAPASGEESASRPHRRPGRW